MLLLKQNVTISMSRKAVKVELSSEHYKILFQIREALGLENDTEAMRAAIRLAYEILKKQGLIQEKE